MQKGEAVRTAAQKLAVMSSADKQKGLEAAAEALCAPRPGWDLRAIAAAALAALMVLLPVAGAAQMLL